jgi:hypothetical protein
MPCVPTPGRLTDDHIVPMWARERHLAITAPYQAHGTPNPAAIKWRICGGCNATLGRTFENDAPKVIGPMISGSVIRLTPAAQAFAAGWLAKTTFALGLADSQQAGAPDTGHADILRWHLTQLMRGSYPLKRICVRLGRFPAGHNEPMHPVEDLNRLMPNGRLPNETRMASVQSIGYLAWQLLVWGPLASFEVQEFVRWSEHNDWLVRVHPPSSPFVAWPLSRTLCRDDFLALRTLAEPHRHPSTPNSRRRVQHLTWSAEDGRASCITSSQRTRRRQPGRVRGPTEGSLLRRPNALSQMQSILDLIAQSRARRDDLIR